MTSAVLFDLGGVLIDWNPRHLYRRHLADPAVLDDFLSRVCPPEWNLTLDAGKSFAQAVAERQLLFPEYAELIARWKDDWEEMLGGEIAESVDLLSRVRARGHRILALTNWSAETFPVGRRRFPFLGWFEDIVVSGEVKLIKPDRRIYELVLARNQLAAEETLFIDDSLPNVEAARALGMQAILFESPTALARELEQRGIL